MYQYVLIYWSFAVIELQQSTANTGLHGALADITRWRIIDLLSRQDRCVCHLIEDLALGQSIVSHHVGVLHRAGIITSYPHPTDRRWIYYQLDRDRIAGLAKSLSNLASIDHYNPERLPCSVDLRVDAG